MQIVWHPPPLPKFSFIPNLTGLVRSRGSNQYISIARGFSQVRVIIYTKFLSWKICPDQNFHHHMCKADSLVRRCPVSAIVFVVWLIGSESGIYTFSKQECKNRYMSAKVSFIYLEYSISTFHTCATNHQFSLENSFKKSKNRLSEYLVAGIKHCRQSQPNIWLEALNRLNTVCKFNESIYPHKYKNNSYWNHDLHPEIGQKCVLITTDCTRKKKGDR